MRSLFLRFMLYWMYKDIQITKDCIKNAKELLAEDERRIHFYEMELMELEREK